MTKLLIRGETQRGHARGLEDARGPRWGRGAHRRVVTSPARRGGEASARSLGARARSSRGCGAGTGRAPEAWASPRPRPRSALRFLPAVPPAAASAAGPGLRWEGRCHSPSPRRPGSCVAGAGVSSARPAAASDPARPPSPQRLTRAFPARAPHRAPRAAGCGRALRGP